MREDVDVNMSHSTWTNIQAANRTGMERAYSILDLNYYHKWW